MRAGSAQAPSAAVQRRVGTVPRRRQGLRQAAVLLVIAAVMVALVRSLLVQSFVVPTGSMDPTVRAGDRVLVSRLSYRLGEVRRGDVIVFDGAGVFEPAVGPANSPLSQVGRGVASAFGMPIGAHDYVKRVVGLPGERVACCDESGRITVDGKPLVEPYIHPTGPPSMTAFDVVVPPDRLWVLGDHRGASADSRSHMTAAGEGTVPVDHVVGRVVGIYWPTSRAGVVSHGPERPRTDSQQAEGRR